MFSYKLADVVVFAAGSGGDSPLPNRSASVDSGELR
jgi:hypothetical protein